MPDAIDLACVECTAGLAAFQTGLLPEEDSSVVDEHLAGCPNCRLFSDQIDATVQFIEALPPRQSTQRLVESLVDIAPAAQASNPGDLLRQLCRLADSLDPIRAEDLVQQAFLSAIERDPQRLDLSELARDLTDNALDDAEPTLRGLDDFDQHRPVRDTDADSAELYYPDFYETGPDIGQFVDAPIIWGEANRLTPEADVQTGELFGFVEDAIEQLPAPLGQLVELVDIEQISLFEAASMLRLSPDDAARGLNRARIHVRGAVNTFIG